MFFKHEINEEIFMWEVLMAVLIPIILVMYIIAILVNEYVSVEVRNEIIISYSISVFMIESTNLLRITEYLKTINEYEKIIYTILFSTILFVLNFNSNKILEKTFAYYFANYEKNLLYIFIPLFLRVILLLFNQNTLHTNFIIIYCCIFYTIFTIQIIVDSFRWNKNIILNKYSVLYERILIEIPFKAQNDNQYYLQWKELQSKEKININYEKIYIKRLEKLTDLREIEKLKLDRFTLILIEKSINEQQKKIIFLSNHNTYDYLSDFFNKISATFLMKLLLIPNFTFENNDKYRSFYLIISNYIEKTKESNYGYLESKLLEERKNDLDEIFIKKSLTLSYYNVNMLNSVEYSIRTSGDTINYVILEAIQATHNMLYKKAKIIHNEHNAKYDVTGEQWDFKTKIYDNNLKELEEKMNKLESIFFDVSLRTESYFTFPGVYSTGILKSKIVENYYTMYYWNLSQKMKEKDFNIKNNIEKFNDYLKLSNKLWFRNNKEEIKEEVNGLIMNYKYQLFTDNLWISCNFLVENYNVINGVLNDTVRNNINKALISLGEYDIPILEQHIKSSSMNNLEKIIEFQRTYEEQFKNQEDYFIFKNKKNIVKQKRISKTYVANNIINTLIKNNEINKNDESFIFLVTNLKNYSFIQKTLGMLWVLDEKKYRKLVDDSNRDIIKGVHKQLHHIIENSLNGEFTYIKENRQLKVDIEEIVQKFKYLFENLKLVENLSLNWFESVDYIESINIPYTIKNLDETVLNNAGFSFEFLLERMSNPIDFVRDFIESNYIENYEINCYFLDSIYNIFNKHNLENEKIHDEIYVNIIDKIVERNVNQNNMYIVKNIHEYSIINRLYKNIESKKVKNYFNKKILSKIDSYFISAE